MIDANDPRLTAYVLGELESNERLAIDDQIKRSPELARMVAELEQAAAVFRSALESEQCPTLMPQQREAIQCRAEEAEPQAAAATPLRAELRANVHARRRLVFMALAATLLVAVVGIGAWVQSGGAGRQLGYRSGYENDLSRDQEVMDPGQLTPDDSGELTAEYTEDSIRYSNGPSAGQFAGEADLYIPMPGDPEEATALHYGGMPASSSGSSPVTSPAPSTRSESSTSRPRYSATDYGDSAEESAGMMGGMDAEMGAGMMGGMGGVGGGGGGKVRRANPADWPGFRPTRGGMGMDVDMMEGMGGMMQGKNPVDSGLMDDTAGLMGMPGLNSRVPAFGELPPGAAGVDDRADLEIRNPTRSPSTIAGRDTAVSTLDVSREVDANKYKRGEEKPAGPDHGRRSWRRDQATPNATRLMVGDRDDLPLEGVQVNVLIDGFRARVLMDLYYYNNRSQQLEGSFQLRLPDEASLYYFAFGQTAFEYRPMVDHLATNGFLSAELVRGSGTGPEAILDSRRESWGAVKEARVVPREKAAHAYSEVVRRRVDPALVEWSGAGVFSAKVFPLMPNKLHRVVVAYDVNLTREDEDLVYRLDLPFDVRERMVDINVAALGGVDAELTPTAAAFTSGGRAYYHYKDPAERTIEVRLSNAGAVALAGDDESGSYFAARVTPQLPAGELEKGSSNAIFLLDTSLSSNPGKFNVWLQLLESTLDANRDTMTSFAVLFFNVESHWWRDGFVQNTPENVRQLIADCQRLALEGATDLELALREATNPSTWEAKTEYPRPDLFLLSDGAATWGATNVHSMGRALRSGTGGTLFAYNTGLAGTAIGLLEHLARESGGAVFAIAGEDEIPRVAQAHRSRPWQLLDVTAAGGSDFLLAGRPRSIYPGQSLLLVGRGQPHGEIQLRARRGDQDRVVRVPIERTIASELTPRIYGQVAVDQLEEFSSVTEDVSIAYARHFRVTGQTCSLLMLESEADYQRFQIGSESDVVIVKSVPVTGYVARKLDEYAAKLESAKARLVAWLEKLETLPGLEFRIPGTVRSVLLSRLPDESFEVEVPRLECRERARAELPKKYFQQLAADQLDYDIVSEEAARRKQQFGSADALKALSNLVESSPGDPVLLGDVAFSALEWNLGGQAYPLLSRAASLRPFQPQAYLALAQCLTEMGHADLAMIYYEVILAGGWHERYQDVRQIAAVEYLYLLERIQQGQLSSQVPDFAAARLGELSPSVVVGQSDLVVTMMWNTDRTDVDLHVLEPSGEECFYKNRSTRAGGQITRDVTEGFGPEMYFVPHAQRGKYVVMANYFGSDANRTSVRTKVFVNVYEFFGTKQQRVSKRTVVLNRGSEKRELATVVLEK